MFLFPFLRVMWDVERAATADRTAGEKVSEKIDDNLNESVEIGIYYFIKITGRHMIDRVKDNATVSLYRMNRSLIVAST